MSTKKFAVTLSKPGERTQHTFTWAATREQAAERMHAQMAQSPDLWAGWTAAVADQATDDTRLLTAVARFAEQWGSLMETLPSDYHCTMTCEEAEAAAELFRALGDNATAVGIIDAHAEHDEPGEAHYKGERNN